jgi:hypothetical protein
MGSWSGTIRKTNYQRRKKEHEKQEKQQLRDTRGRHCDSGKAKDCRQHGHQKKHQRPIQHVIISFGASRIHGPTTNRSRFQLHAGSQKLAVLVLAPHGETRAQNLRTRVNCVHS